MYVIYKINSQLSKGSYRRDNASLRVSKLYDPFITVSIMLHLYKEMYKSQSLTNFHLKLLNIE